MDTSAGLKDRLAKIKKKDPTESADMSGCSVVGVELKALAKEKRNSLIKKLPSIIS